MVPEAKREAASQQRVQGLVEPFVSYICPEHGRAAIAAASFESRFNFPSTSVAGGRGAV